MRQILFAFLLFSTTLTAQDGWKFIGPEEKPIRFLTMHGDVIFTSVTVVPPGGGFSTGRIYRSSDAGASWEVVDSTVIDRLSRIAFVGGDPPRLIGGNGSTLYYSDDLGMTWDSKYHQNIPPFSRYYVKENVPGLIFAIGALGPGGQLESLYRSTDYGRSWAETYDFPKSTDGSSLAVGLSQTTPDVYVNVETGIGGEYFYHSTDDGVTWSFVTFGNYVTQMMVDPDDPAIIYASRIVRTVRSSDRGLSWTQIFDNGTTVLQDRRNPSLLFVLGHPRGSQPGVFISEDRGNTWRFDSTSRNLPFKHIFNPFDPITWLQYDPGRKRLYLQTEKGIYMRENFLTSVSEERTVETRLSVFPQPARDKLDIVTGRLLPGRSATLHAIDPLGRILQEWSVDTSKRIAWDLTDHSGAPIPSGAYLLLLKDGDTLLTQRIMIVR